MFPFSVVVAWSVTLEVTFRVPPTFRLFACVSVVPDTERVEVPDNALAVLQNGKVLVVTADEVVTVPLPPPPEMPSVDVATHWMPPVAVELAIGTVPFAPGVGTVCETSEADAMPAKANVTKATAEMTRCFIFMNNYWY
jgi:hypothetical protein